MHEPLIWRYTPHEISKAGVRCYDMCYRCNESQGCDDPDPEERCEDCILLTNILEEMQTRIKALLGSA